MENSRIEKLIKLAEKKGLIRPRVLTEVAIPRQYLSIACNRGELVRVGRGLYSLPDKILSEYRSLAEVCKRVPSGIICLLSALQYLEKEYLFYFIPGVTTLAKTQLFQVNNEKNRKKTLAT